MTLNLSAKYFSIAICTFIVVCIATPSQADILNVPADFPTIQAAIDAAVDEQDEVVVADGTYTGEGNNNLNFHGVDMIVRSANGPDNCIIDLAGSGRVGFRFNSGENEHSIVEGFTIRNGNAGNGSAIYISIAGPIIRGNHFENNTGTNGGAIYMQFGGATVIDNLFSGNSSSGNGGALYISQFTFVELINNDFIIDNSAAGSGGALCANDSNLTICGGNITGNEANFGGGLYGFESTINAKEGNWNGNTAAIFGGAVVMDHSVMILMDSDVTGNSAGSGGGGFATSSESSIEVKNVIFRDNTTGSPNANGSGDGGAMFNLGVPATIIDCIFENNAATRGGAIYNSQTNLLSTNCLFFGNTATSTGGAIYNSQSHPQIRLAAMWGNSAASGGGLYNTTSSFPNISNSILNNNTPSQIVNVGGSIATVTYSNIQGGWAGTGNINQNPMFVDPVNGDFNLAPGSPCIDAGNNAAVPFGIDTDLLGNPRFVDDPKTDDTGQGKAPIVDMGSYEFQVISTCPWDIDGSGSVGTSDLLALFAQWGTAGPADFDGNGVVNTTDLLILFANWGPCP